MNTKYDSLGREANARPWPESSVEAQRLAEQQAAEYAPLYDAILAASPIEEQTRLLDKLQNTFDWSGVEDERLLLFMGKRSLPLLVHRVASRPARMDPGNEARAYWLTALSVLGKIGESEHIAYIEGLAAAVGDTAPKIRDACDQAVVSIRERAPVEPVPKVEAAAPPQEDAGTPRTLKKIQGIVKNVEQLLRKDGIDPKITFVEPGYTCTCWIEAKIDGAQYAIEIKISNDDPDDPNAELYPTWAHRRPEGAESIDLVGDRNFTKTETDKKVLLLCRQINEGRFGP